MKKCSKKVIYAEKKYIVSPVRARNKSERTPSSQSNAMVFDL